MEEQDNFDYDTLISMNNGTHPTNTKTKIQTNSQSSFTKPSTESQLCVPAQVKSVQKQRQQQSFGKQQFTTEERERIRKLLQQKLKGDEVSTRPGASGHEYTYIASNKAIDIANDTFKYNGWSCSIVDITPDYIEERNGSFKCGVSAVVRITLRDGSYHEDVGVGAQENKNKGTAIENAKKEAVSDARKRALRLFGNRLGNCLYDKEYVKVVRAEEKKMLQQQQERRQAIADKAINAVLPATPQHSVNGGNHVVSASFPQQPQPPYPPNLANMQQSQLTSQPTNSPQYPVQQPPPHTMPYNGKTEPIVQTYAVPHTSPANQFSTSVQPVKYPPPQLAPPPNVVKGPSPPQAPFMKGSPPSQMNQVNDLYSQPPLISQPTNSPQSQFTPRYSAPPANQTPNYQMNHSNGSTYPTNSFPSNIPSSSDDAAYEDLLLRVETEYNQKVTGQKNLSPPNEEYQRFTPPDKKRKAELEVAT